MSKPSITEITNALILDSAGDGIYGTNADGIITFINPAGAKIIGCDQEKLIGTSQHEVLHQSLKKNIAIPISNCPVCETLRDGNVQTANRVMFFNNEKSMFPVEFTSSPIIVDGHIKGCVTIFRNITNQLANERRLQLSHKVFEHTQEGIIVTDKDANIVDVNVAYEKITGYDREEMIGANPNIMQSGRHDKAFFDKMWSRMINVGSWSGEIWDRRKNGEIYPKWLSIDAIYDVDKTVSFYVGIFSDITIRKNREERLESLAFFDPLTNLPNRALFYERLTQSLVVSKRKSCQTALLFIDLDHFKNINDTLGHISGDELLVQVAERINKCIRKSDTAARLAGDEFTVILPEVTGPDVIGMVAKKIIDSIQEDFDIYGKKASIGSSIGIAF